MNKKSLHCFIITTEHNYEYCSYFHITPMCYDKCINLLDSLIILSIFSKKFELIGIGSKTNKISADL